MCMIIRPASRPSPFRLEDTRKRLVKCKEEAFSHASCYYFDQPIPVALAYQDFIASVSPLVACAVAVLISNFASRPTFYN